MKERRLRLLAMLLVLAAYSRAVEGGFVWDDHALIEEQPHVQQLSSPTEYFGRMFWSDPLDPSRSFYRPVVTLSYAVDYAVWNGKPWGFHLVNVIAHLIAALLLVMVCRKAGAGEGPAVSLALLWALLPRLTESVAWISGRTDVFAAIGVFSALILWTDKEEGGRRRWLAALAVLLGLLSKEVAIAVVPALILLQRPDLAARRSQRLAQLFPIALAVILYAALRVFAQTRDVRPELAGVPPLPIPDRVAAAAGAVGEYARMLIDALRPEFQIGSVGAPSRPMILFGVVAVVITAIVLARVWKNFSAWTRAALVAAGAALALVLHLVPLNVNVLAADRFLYLPTAMGAVALAPLAERWAAARKNLALGLLGVAVVLLGVATFLRTTYWLDEYTLWKSAVAERTPGQTRTLFGLAGLLMDAGLHARALPYLEQAIQEESAAPELKTYNAYAVSLEQTGSRARAVELWEDMARKQPNARRPRLNLAMAYARAGRWDESLAELQRIESALPGVVGKTREVVLEARRRTDALPAPTRDEPITIVSERADIASLLGAKLEANRLWLMVLKDPAASRELLIRAAGHLAFNAAPDDARSAISAAAPRVGDRELVDSLNAAIDDRDRLR